VFTAVDQSQILADSVAKFLPLSSVPKMVSPVAAAAESVTVHLFSRLNVTQNGKM